MQCSLNIIILVQGVCPLKIKLLNFLMDSILSLTWRRYKGFAWEARSSIPRIKDTSKVK